MTIDVSPGAIARRLLTDHATPDDCALVQAMAERALREIETDTPALRLILVERMMVSAARQILAQHEIRWDRLIKLLDEPEGQ